MQTLIMAERRQGGHRAMVFFGSRLMRRIVIAFCNPENSLHKFFSFEVRRRPKKDFHTNFVVTWFAFSLGEVRKNRSSPYSRSCCNSNFGEDKKKSLPIFLRI